MRAPGVVLFGGAFNPPHRTHRRVLETALAALPVARALVIPCGVHPLKSNDDLAPERARLRLCRAAFGDLAGVTVSEIECGRGGVAYTIDTVRQLRDAMPDQRLFLLIGSDNLHILDAWRSHHELLQLVTPVTYPRHGYPIERAQLQSQDLTPEEIDALLANVLSVAPDDVNATAIRAALRAGEAPRDLTPEVVACIRELGLYGSG